MGKIIAVVNQKGGVGKTTTAVNLTAALHDLGLKVLMCDYDPQANATSGLGVDKRKIKYSAYDVTINNVMPLWRRNSAMYCRPPQIWQAQAWN